MPPRASLVARPGRIRLSFRASFGFARKRNAAPFGTPREVGLLRLSFIALPHRSLFGGSRN